MNLVVDIGNTRVKTGVFNQDQLVEAKVFDQVDSTSLQEIVDMHGVTHVLVASTGEEVGDNLVHTSGILLKLSSGTPVPIENLYKTPETLGQDRLAGVVGAAWLYPGSHVLVIDAGTCITYDLLEDSGKYIGGNIAPGLDMRYLAMHDYTQRLPAVQRGDVVSLMGDTTEEALQNGGLMGVLMEIAGYMEMLRPTYPELNTILTGGDATYLAEHLKARLTVQPHLILIGLNQILQFNVSKYN